MVDFAMILRMSLATRYTQILWDGQDENGGKNGEATRWGWVIKQ